MQNVRFGVAGAGATGAFLAAALTNAGFHVTVLARGASAAAIAKDGITVRGPDNRTITARPAATMRAGDDIEPVDVTLFCVKSYDTDAAARTIAPLVGDSGVVLCLQNGVANEDVLAAAYSADRVLSGVLYIGSERVAPGVIECTTDARIILGPYHGSATRSLWQPLRDAFVAAGVDCAVNEDIRSAKWQKFLFNCGLNPLTALVGQRLGAIRSDGPGQEIFDALVDEAISAAVASGAPITGDARTRVAATADRMDISSSMAEDLAAGRPMEIDAFTGHVLRLAREHHVAAPTTSVVDGLLRVLDAGAGRGAKK